MLVENIHVEEVSHCLIVKKNETRVIYIGSSSLLEDAPVESTFNFYLTYFSSNILFS